MGCCGFNARLLMRILAIILLLANCSYGQMRMMVNGHMHAGASVKTIAIAFNSGGGQLYGGTNWNNHVSGTNSTNTVTSNLVYLEDGTNSGISSTLSNNSNTPDNGAGYCSSTTSGFPADVLRYGSNAALASRTITFANVPAGTHTLNIISTRATQAGSFNFTISGNTSNTISEIQNNCNGVATLTFTTAGGSVAVTLTRVTGSFQYLTALKLLVTQ